MKPNRVGVIRSLTHSGSLADIGNIKAVEILGVSCTRNDILIRKSTSELRKNGVMPHWFDGRDQGVIRNPITSPPNLCILQRTRAAYPMRDVI